MAQPIRVLVVDDSALAREMLVRGLNADPQIEVVATAHDVYDARDKIVYLDPDVMTLDVNMPRMDGLTFLRKLIPQYPLPVIMVSSLTQQGVKVTMDALAAGAVDFVSKPSTQRGGQTRAAMLEALRSKVKQAAGVEVNSVPKFAEQTQAQVLQLQDSLPIHKGLIAIGASTGGTKALENVLTALPAEMPGILVVQHMPPNFTRAFAERLDSICRLSVREARHGDCLHPGEVLVAPGGYQMTLRSKGRPYVVDCHDQKKVNNHCPSVDVMMHSVARYVGRQAISIILTGMGSDGAKGMQAMKRQGALTISQNKGTCVVYGMPKAAYDLGVVDHVLPIQAIGPALVRKVEQHWSTAA